MNLELVKQLFEQFEGSTASKMKIEIEDIKLELEKPTTMIETTDVIRQPVVQIKQEELPVVVEQSGEAVKSPIVGVFYASSSPDAASFVEVGTKVKAGQVICIIEAMKVMNEIKAPQDGIITEILVKDKDVVEYNQSIMIIGE